MVNTVLKHSFSVNKMTFTKNIRVIEYFIKRFRKKTVHEVIGLRTIRMVTVAVGVVVVAISLYVYVVPGNLYEVTYRVANLLTAPLLCAVHG